MVDPSTHNPDVNFFHTLLRARDYQHRPEFQTVCDWWRQGGEGVCALVGIGGAGKTAIADRFLRVLPGAMAQDRNLAKDPILPMPKGLLVFSFYSAPNPEILFDQLSVLLAGEPNDEPRNKRSYYQVLELLQGASSLLLVLDGLEKVQDDGARGGVVGQIEHTTLRDLLLRVAQGYLPGVGILVTTRFVLDDLEYDQSPNYRAIDITQIPIESCVGLLRERGVRGSDSDLRLIAEECGYHALTVDLTGGYIARFGNGDPRTPLQLTSSQELQRIAKEAPDRRLRYVAEQSAGLAGIAKSYHQALARNDPDTLTLFEWICLFRLGVKADVLASIPALTTLSTERLRTKLAFLTEMRLLESSDERYTVHPAVRDGFLNGLSAERVRIGHWGARHVLQEQLEEKGFSIRGSRVDGMLVDVPYFPGSTPSDTETLDLLEEMIYHTLEVGDVRIAFELYMDQIGGFQNLGYRLGAYERGDRICRTLSGVRSPEFAQLPTELMEDQQALFLSEWALYLRALGRLTAAAHCYERSVELAMNQRDWRNAAIGKLNLAEVHLLAGRLVAGLEVLEEALTLAADAANVGPRLARAFMVGEQRSRIYAVRAHARTLRGLIDPALGDFSTALEWQNKQSGDAERSLSGLPGVQDALLLACLGRTDDARQLMTTNIEILKSSNPANNTIPPCRLLLADLARERGNLDEAYKLHEEAHERALADDDKELLCWSALVRSRLYLAEALKHKEHEETKQAVQRLHDCLKTIEEGLHIAREFGYGIYHIDLLNTRARVYLLQGNATTAERDARIALFGLAEPTSGTGLYDAPALNASTPLERRGIFPPKDSGWPELMAATHPGCGYSWGEGDARHTFAEALLLQTAQVLGRSDFVPARLDGLPTEVQALITRAQEELDACRKLRKRIKDPKRRETERVWKTAKDGVLTGYPLNRVEEILRVGNQGTSPRVFISHSSKDKAFVRKLVNDLKARDLNVWVDELELKPGDSIVQGISAGLKDTDYLIAVLSAASVKSRWVQAELNSALMIQLSDDGVTVLPALIEDCAIPTLLRDRQYADFRNDYNAGFNSLLSVLGHEAP